MFCIDVLRFCILGSRRTSINRGIDEKSNGLFDLIAVLFLIPTRTYRVIFVKFNEMKSMMRPQKFPLKICTPVFALESPAGAVPINDSNGSS